MSPWTAAAVLIGGIVIAAMVTRWVNWFTYGQNRERALQQQREEDAKASAEKPREH